jgi:glycosyltransferase involved in cell wall biosynthesis
MVSIIVPTMNNEKTLELCLKSVRAQIYQNIELIVVDGGSTDATIKIAEAYADLVIKSIGERSKQRNLGFKKAKGDVFLFLDSDMVLSRNVVFEAVRKFDRHKDMVALYIPEVVEGDTFLSQILNFERSFYNENVIDAVRFVKRHVFNELKGFDENLVSAEDWDLDHRIRLMGKVGSVASLLYHLQYGLTLKKYLNKKLYYSGKIDRYLEKWGKNNEEVKKQVGFGYRFFQVFTENGKWRKLIGKPFMVMCMLAVKLLVAIIFYIKSRERLSSFTMK